METMKILVDGNEIEFVSSIPEEAIERNMDIVRSDTIILDEVVSQINEYVLEEDKYEWYKSN